MDNPAFGTNAHLRHVSTSVFSEEGPPKKRRKPRSEKRAASQAARAAKQSGTGNAEEALRIRGLLGLVPEVPAPAAPAAVAAAPAVEADATPAGFRVSDLFAAGPAEAAAEPADSSVDEGPGSAPIAQTPGRFSFNFAVATGKEEAAGQADSSDGEPAELQQQQGCGKLQHPGHSSCHPSLMEALPPSRAAQLLRPRQRTSSRGGSLLAACPSTMR